MYVVLILFLLLLAVLAGGNYCYNRVLNAKVSKKEVLSSKDLPDAHTSGVNPPESMKWLLEEAAVEERFCVSTDGLKLFARQIRSDAPAENWIICAHGFSANGKQLADKAKHLHEMGYHLLLPDLRGHGQSEGNYIGMGWHDRLDILKWLEILIKEHPEAQVALYGVSMGATTMLLCSGEELPTNVRAVVADCGYSTAWREFTSQGKKVTQLPAVPVLCAMDLVTQLRAGYSIREVNAVKAVARSKTPTLFIHGDADKFVPFEMQDELYRAAACEKEKLIVHGAGHVMSATVDPEAYWTAVGAFLKGHLA